jgi:UDP-4-amino-4,6-dideoxy-N-acetyl-beta-L-altrosamine transaminase
VTAQTFLPYGRQSIDEDDVAAVVAALRGEMLTTGPLVNRFEEALASKVGSAGAVSCNSATSGLHLAAAAAGIGPGDFAIVPSITFLATANAVRYCGGEVVFADVDPQSGLLTPETLEAAIARSPKPPHTILPVHLNGWSCDMVGLAAIAKRHGARLIEDAAHAIGATQPDGNGGLVPVGACRLSDMAVFSFHPVKTITTCEGGAVTAKDPEILRRLGLLRSHGMVRDPAQFERRDLAFDDDGSVNPWYYEMPEFGWNLRQTDVHCALGLAQLDKLDRFLARREEIAARYDAALAHLAPHLRPTPRRPQGRSGWHLYPVLIDFAALGTSRARVMKALREEYSVGTQVHYIPVHMQPYYQRRYGDLDLPGAWAYYSRVLSIPFYASLKEAEVDRVCHALERVLSR